MNRKKALKLFFKKYDMDDIMAEYVGELYEDCIEEFSYTFGNGELIISFDEDTVVYVVDDYGFNKYLSEF